jgi:hypothetical protein
MPPWEFQALQSLREKEVLCTPISRNSIVADLLSVTGSVIALQSSRGCCKRDYLQVFEVASVGWVCNLSCNHTDL